TVEVDLAFGREREALRGATRRALAQGELCIAKLCSGGCRVTAGGSGDVHQRVLELDVSVAAHRAGFGVVFDLAGTDPPITLGRLDVALEGGVAIDTERCLIADDVDRAAACGLASGRRGGGAGCGSVAAGCCGSGAGRRWGGRARHARWSTDRLRVL